MKIHLKIRQKIFVFLILLVGFWGFTDNSIAATYYVDYNNGNDQNIGTTQSSPWKHSPGDTNASGNSAIVTLKPGDTVYFKKGVTYIGQIMAQQSGSEQDAGKNGTIAAEGVFTSEGQNFLTTAKAGDWIYIYNESNTGAYNNAVGFWQIGSVDSNTKLKLIAFDGSIYSTAELSYRIWRPIHYTSTNWGTGDATISGNSYYYYVIRVNNNYLMFSNLKFINGRWPTGYPGSTCTWPDGSSSHAAIWNNGSATGLVVYGCTFYNFWNAVYVLPSSSGFFVLKNNFLDAIGSLGLVGSNYSLIENNTINDTGSTIRGAGKYSIVRFNKLTDNVHASSLYCGTHSDGIGPFFSSSSDPGGNQYGWIYGNYVANTVMGIFLEYNNGGTSHWTIHSNVLIGYYGAGGSGSTAIMVRDAPYTKVYNNVIFGLNNSTGWASSVVFEKSSVGSGSPNCQFKNNIIYAGSSVKVTDTESQTGFSSEGNVYYLLPSNPYLGWGTTKVTWAQWQALGLDNKGYSFFGVNPEFIDITGTAYSDIDLKLTADSPVRISPYSLSVETQDAEKVIRVPNQNWTRGAYESNSGTISKPNAPSGLTIVAQM